MTAPLLINEPPLQVLPTLARHIGLNEAIVLQQIHYWLNPQFNRHHFEGRYWVRNTYERWQKQFPFWSERTIRRTIMNLEERDLLVSCMGGHLKQIKFYTIHYDVLTKMASEDSSPSSKRGNTSGKEDQGPLTPEWAENQRFCPSGQNGHLTWPKWPDGESAYLDQDSEETARNQASHPAGQNDQLIGSTWPPHLAKVASSSGQIGHLSYSKNTLREYKGKNTLPPPLTPPPSISRAQNQEEEEENKKIARELTHANPRFDGEKTQPFPPSVQENPMDSTLSIPQDPPIFQDMLKIWDQTVQAKLYPEHSSPFAKTVLTEKRQNLLARFVDAFLRESNRQNQLEDWQDYCSLIAQSRYLAGHNPSGFKVTLDWALVPDNALKVVGGGIYDKPEPVKPQPTVSWEEFSEDLAKILPGSPYLPQWVKISVSLAQMIGQTKYRSWFSKVLLKELTPTQVVFAVERDFAKDYILRHFSSEVRCAVQAHFPAITQIDFIVVANQGGVA